MPKPTSLLPIIRVAAHNQQFVGTPGDSHADIERRYHVFTWNDAQRGFTHNNGATFLSRREAADWVKQHNSALWSVVGSQVDAPVGLHSHHLSPNTDISKCKVLVYDKGLYLYLAQRLGEHYSHVYYYIPESSPYPKSAKSNIGTGIPNVQRVYEFWPYVDKVDMIVFFDAYEGEMQQWLRERGYRVFGSGRSERIELDKIYFLDSLERAGLPVPPTEVTYGLDELADYLRTRRDKWLKTPYYRGDFETKHYTSWRQLQPWLEWLHTKIGEARSLDIPILVQDPIKSEAEVGYDGFCIDGKYTDNCIVGYEVKDKGLVAKIFPTVPDILSIVNAAMSPIYAELGFRGHYSTEIRVTASGKPYYIDPTCRVPSPPGELMCEMYRNYPHAIWQIASGLVPILEPIAKYGAEIVLSSSWHGWSGDDTIGHELCVEFPEEHTQHVKLKNHCKRNGAYYITPNYNAGAFGNVVAWADDMESAIEQAVKIAESVKCDDLEWDKKVFDEAEEAVMAGEKFGIKW